MRAETLLDIIDSDFYVGVPDSQLRAVSDCLMSRYGMDLKHHIIAANEGNCAGIAAGYYLSTGKIPVVYMQNSGEGNIINPVTSLFNESVYGIPCIFIIGWRGEPGVKDEPQHVFQGKVTLKLLADLDIESYVIDVSTSDDDVRVIMRKYRIDLMNGKQVAFVVRKGALSCDTPVSYANDYTMNREDVIAKILEFASDDIIVSTTGKASREVFELREKNKQSHSFDFLTVGSMGHASSIALGIAINKPDKRVWCIDGDGAVLMHMGAMPVIGSKHLSNLVHIVLDNESYETVGGMPAVAPDFVKIAEACGYDRYIRVDTFDELTDVLGSITTEEASWFVDIKCSLFSRKDLGRPTISPIENKHNFMEILSK